MNMARRQGPGDYQIGAWSVVREGRRWVASTAGIRNLISHDFPTLGAAHLQLTGEPRQDTRRSRQ